MTLSLLFGCAWVLSSTIVALIPMRWQYPPGILLLIAAPFLIAWICWDHGVWVAGLALFAFVSMFRNPLRYFVNRAMGKETEVPT